MLKLKLDFEVTLPAVSDAFNQSVVTSHILPFKDGRAIVFGWGSNSGQTVPFPHGYWLAELTRDGATTRVLPEALTHGGEGLLVPPQSGVFLQSFLLGERFGILLTPEALLLFDGIHAEPQRIAISGHFSGLGELAHSSHAADSHYEVVHCGFGDDRRIPVVLAAPTSRGAGRHLALLEIDAEAKSARWLHTQSDGSPRSLAGADYAGFDAKLGATATLSQIDQQSAAPLVYDCAWTGQDYLVYAAGYSKNYNRFGMPLSVLTRNSVDLGVLAPVFHAGEPSHGDIAASLDRLIVSPLHKSGPRKGKQTVVTLADGQEHPVTPPRGYAGHQVLACNAGHYWLAPMPRGYNRAPFALQVCREA